MAALSPTYPMPAPAQTTPAGAASVLPDALVVLREATAALHERLDSRLPIAREDAGLPAYRQHVALIDDWLAEIDRLPLPAGGWPGGWCAAQQGRRSRIAADLADSRPNDLAAGRTASLPFAAGPDATAESTAGNAGFAWGVAYVVEGSQLGGQMLYRRLRDRLAPQPLHYLRGDGSSGAWPRFTAALRVALADPADLEAARQGAVWAFASLSSRFERAGVFA